MTLSGMVRTGVVGAAIAAVCCATPILVLALGAVGLVSAAVWLDWRLIPALLAFLALAGYGLYRQRRAPACAADVPTEHRESAR